MFSKRFPWFSFKQQNSNEELGQNNMAKRYRDHEGTWKQVFLLPEVVESRCGNWNSCVTRCQTDVQSWSLCGKRGRRGQILDHASKIEMNSLLHCYILLLVKQQYKINHTEEVY